MTDNRTNEPTEAQVEAAAKAWDEAVAAYREAELDWEAYLSRGFGEKPLHPHDLRNPYRKEKNDDG